MFKFRVYTVTEPCHIIVDEAGEVFFLHKWSQEFRRRTPNVEFKADAEGDYVHNTVQAIMNDAIINPAEFEWAKNKEMESKG
jgi:hypothetical protein